MCYVASVMSDSCDLMDCSLPGSSVHGILQAKILEWVLSPPPGIFPTQGLNPGLLYALQWQAGSLTLEPPGMPIFPVLHNMSL